jgi:superfamily II DNA or RNA helicase
MLTIIPNDQIEKLKNRYPSLADCDDKFILYQNTEYSYLPRYFFKQFPFDKYIFFNDSNFSEKEINIEFTKSLRDYQEEGANFILNSYRTNGYVNGIFEALVGYGKTTVATFLTSTLKKKTLIVIDNSKLMQQWIEAYLEFTNLTIDDIGIIKGKKLEFDKAVTIANVQTLMSRVRNNLNESYPIFRDAGFGLIFYDEVHKTSSGPRFATSTLLLPSKNIIGLSATPFAHDINAILLYNSIGNVIYEYKDYKVKPKYVYFLKYSSGLGPKHSNRVRILRDYIKAVAYYNSIIFENKAYLQLIYEMSKKCVDVNHKILIIAITIKQVENIIKYFSDRGLKAVPIYSKSNDINKGTDSILVGTMKFASAGFDYPQLSALILAAPLKGRTTLIQSIGRVVRSYPDKNSPIVIDLIDTDFPSLFENNIITKINVIKKEFNIEDEVFNILNYQFSKKDIDYDDY